MIQPARGEQTGSMGSEATHTRTLGGIADLVGNVWEWQDGLLLQDGRFKISAYNTQAEVDWAFVDAFLDASTPTGGSAILSNAVNNRLGSHRRQRQRATQPTASGEQ